MQESSVHQFNPDMAPDSEFVPGALKYLLVGNRGRWMDPRRTPFHVVALVPQTGHFVIEIDDFEDRGARLEIPFERVTSYQIAAGSAEASSADILRLTEIVARFDQPLQIPCDSEATARTQRALQERQAVVSTWLSTHSTFLKLGVSLDTRTRRGSRELALDLSVFMEQQGLLDLEEGFATTFVSNPGAELIKGHRIVLAELGLVPYEGSIVRNSDLFDGRWARDRRSAHILNRLSFLRALFERIGHPNVTLYRGLVFDDRPEPTRNKSFVSASFDFEVAKSCFGPRELRRNGLLTRQVVPITRLFMTYLETVQLNRQFLEAEAVLLYEPGHPLF